MRQQSEATAAAAGATTAVDIAAHLLEHGIPFSRNRHFAAYEDPLFARGLALARRLRALAVAMKKAHARGGKISVEQVVRGSERRVRIHIVDDRLRQTSVLERAAFGVLERLDELRSVLAVVDCR